MLGIDTSKFLSATNTKQATSEIFLKPHPKIETTSLDTINMFDYKNLAVEIRLLILPTLVELQPNNSVPAILVALYKDPELYAEALEMYRKVNKVVTVKNQAEFQKTKMVDLLKIRCIRLLLEPRINGSVLLYPHLRELAIYANE